MSATDSIAGRDPTASPNAWPVIAGLTVATIVLVALRLHAFDVPLETDECNYAYIGARLLDGDRLYVDVWDHQPPGAFVLFAGAIAVFGDSPEVYRWMATMFSLATMVLVFGVSRRLGGNGAGLVAAILFAMVSSDPGTAGEGVNREVFMNTFVLGAWWLLVHRQDRPILHVIGAGALLGIGSLLKTVLAIHWLALALWLGFSAFATAPAGRRPGQGIRQFMAFAVGPLVVWTLTFGYFALDGRMMDFVDAAFRFNLSYSSGDTMLERFLQFWSPPKHPFIFESALPLWIAMLVALPWSVYITIRKRDSCLATTGVMILASFVATCLPGRFWPHYYYLLIPGGVVLVAVFTIRAAQFILDRWKQRSGAALCVAVIIGAVVPVFVGRTEYRHYLSQPPFGITLKRYRSRDFWAKAQGENVRRVTDPDDQIFVFGNDTGIYYYSERKCASRYTMITGVQGAYSGMEARRRIMMEELNERMPRLILVMFDERLEENPFPEWVSFLHEHYSEPIGWDFGDRNRKPIMFVVARKDRPVEAINWDWDRREVRGWLMGRHP